MNEISTVAAGKVGEQFNASVLNMIISTGPVVQFVLLLLLIFSVVSWAIIILKHKRFKKIKLENDQFVSVYMDSTEFKALFEESEKFKQSCIAAVFREGYQELTKVRKAMREALSANSSVDSSVPALKIMQIDNFERALNRACSTEVTKLGSALGFLATTGSASPFIGLFGTVWGIMDTFKGIGIRGSATLAVVAPGISEALIATAAGLAAAIPAVIFYNYYINRVKVMAMEMDNFSSELLDIVERHNIKR